MAPFALPSDTMNLMRVMRVLLQLGEETRSLARQLQRSTLLLQQWIMQLPTAVRPHLPVLLHIVQITLQTRDASQRYGERDAEFPDLSQILDLYLRGTESTIAPGVIQEAQHI